MTIDILLSDTNLFGLALGLATFLIIGLFHPLVIKAEYYLGVISWVCFLVGGVFFSILAVYIESFFFSALCGVTAFSSFWSILEVFQQERRVQKGWFAANPNRNSKLYQGRLMESGRIFLCSGLVLLLIAFVVRGMGLPLYCFWTLFGLAITFKTVFLITIFRKKGFKLELWLCLIILGVALMLLSLLFKNIIPNIVVNRALFFSAIALKTVGLILIIVQKRRK